MEVPLASIIVAARNEAASLPALIAALREQTIGRERYEVLIADDNSTDGTASLVQASGFATLVRVPPPGGLSAARNAAIRASSGDILVFTDGHCVPAPDWVERGIEALERTGSDFLGGRIEVTTRPVPSAVELVDLANYYDQEQFVKNGAAAGGNLWVRRRLIDSIGAFDESLALDEDMEFSRRAVAAGHPPAYGADVVVTHAARRGRVGLARKCFYLGLSAAHSGHPQLLRWIRGGDREWRAGRKKAIDAHGYRPPPLKRVSMALVKNLLVRLPMLAGNITGMIGTRSRRRREAPTGGAE
jgi:glycosyltransferase involved in cell wall biosynthesis